jgi:transcription antitermination factor NusG
VLNGFGLSFLTYLKVYLRIKSVSSLSEEIIIDTLDDITALKSDSDRGEEAWYALYTMPRTEKKVAERLESRGFSIYLPMYTTIRQWSDRKKKIQLPLIPGIVFIYTSLVGLSAALQCAGVVRVVRYLRKPARIRDYEINNLRVLLHEPNSVQLCEDVDIAIGIPVQVVQGAFFGVIGTCVRRQGRHHLVVSIESLNRQLELTLPVSFVETQTMPPMHRSPVAMA